MSEHLWEVRLPYVASWTVAARSHVMAIRVAKSNSDRYPGMAGYIRTRKRGEFVVRRAA